jgi:hypothetical protein
MRPNLFQFATSELSQDAFLCWLLSWADAKHEKDHPNLHLVGKNFLTLIYERANVKAPASYSTVEILKQDGNIDILCIINGEIAILIEDKVGTKQHSDQLPRYKEYVFDKFGFAGDRVIPVYIQTRDQGDYCEVVKHGYLVLERQDLLHILESHNGKAASVKSDILDDFSKHLRQVEDDVQSYITLHPSAWSWNSWKGFYTRLQKEIEDGSWDYVANPSGGFLGFWWHFDGNDEYELYLQLEQNKFCFKISVEDVEKRRELREHWHNEVVLRCPDQGIRARRPVRFGNGHYMTVAILDQEFPAVNSDGLLDMVETLKIMQSAESVLDACLAKI